MRINIKPEDCKFHIDEKNRKVVCILEDTMWKLEEFLEDNKNTELLNMYPSDVQMPIRFVGIATCSPDDTWNEDFGKRIAFSRAKKAFYKSFFLTAESYVNKLDNQLALLISALNDFGESISKNLDKNTKYINDYLSNNK